jgi:hypothetical protein
LRDERSLIIEFLLRNAQLELLNGSEPKQVARPLSIGRGAAVRAVALMDPIDASEQTQHFVNLRQP